MRIRRRRTDRTIDADLVFLVGKDEAVRVPLVTLVGIAERGAVPALVYMGQAYALWLDVPHA